MSKWCLIGYLAQVILRKITPVSVKVAIKRRAADKRRSKIRRECEDALERAGVL